MSDDTGPHPTALISWAHTDPGWDSGLAAVRQDHVLRLSSALREAGIDAELDLHHLSEGVDWTRWGPAKIAESDFVIVVVSQRWRSAWEGTGDPTTGAGSAAEADTLRSLFNQDRQRFLQTVRLVQLPGSTDGDIPNGLHGVPRFLLATVDADGVEDLVRSLTAQARYPKARLGPLSVLPPVRLDVEVSGPEAERRKLEAVLEALPVPTEDDPSDLPWYGERVRTERRLRDLDEIAAGASSPSPAVNSKPGPAAEDQTTTVSRSSGETRLIAQRLIEREIARDPAPRGPDEMSHVYVVASPVEADTELLTDLLESTQSSTLMTLMQRVPSQIPNANRISPPWNYLLTRQEPRAEGVGFHSELPGRVLADDAYLRSVADLEIEDGGAIKLLWLRGSDALRGEQLVFATSIATITRHVIFLAGLLGQEVGYAGEWTLALGVTDLAGRRAYRGEDWWGTPPIIFSGDNYIHGTTALTEEMVATHGEVTRRLVRRLMRGLGVPTVDIERALAV